jgi:signal transduction histidine kinase
VTVSIRIRLTIWYAALVACILTLLGIGVLLSAFWGLREAADQELTSGIDGVATFLLHKLDIHQMNDLNDELREHSALLPRGKMFRVSDPNGSIVYQPDAMKTVTSVVPRPQELRRENVEINGRSYRTISRFATVGPYRFLIQVAVDQTEYHKLTIGLAWILILSVPFAGLLAASTGYWMSGRALSPIHRITKSAHSIDARNLSRRLPLLGTNDELDRLSATINHMLDRIATSYERIAQFTADASHELRTPVALIRSNAELLLMGCDNSSAVEHRASDILAESMYMTRLIGDLLTLARSGDEAFPIPVELLELNEIVRAILDRARAQAATCNISLECALSDQVVPLHGNQNMIERVLMILIDNALRFTPQGRSVRIETWITPDHCGFVVHDTGIGIAEKDHERIFERFFRVDTARTPRDGGSGLGLSIARTLIQLHKGTIHVESEMDSGASFRVGFSRADVSESVRESQPVR